MIFVNTIFFCYFQNAAINTLLRSAEKRAQMGAAARKRIEKEFSWTSMSIARQTLAFYQHLITNYGPDTLTR